MRTTLKRTMPEQARNTSTASWCVTESRLTPLTSISSSPNCRRPSREAGPPRIISEMKMPGSPTCTFENERQCQTKVLHGGSSRNKDSSPRQDRRHRQQSKSPTLRPPASKIQSAKIQAGERVHVSRTSLPTAFSPPGIFCQPLFVASSRSLSLPLSSSNST